MEELNREQLLGVIAFQTQTIAQQTQTITKLESKVAELERRLSRNSGNSSLPPSGDDTPGRPTPPRRERRAAQRKQGKQPGAPGRNLGWREDPDDTLPHYPQGTCECGSTLAGATDLGVERSQQVHDVPLVTVKVTQHDLYRVQCGCGREYVATPPPGLASGPVSYGLNLQALVVYLLVFQHVPVARCAQLVADITGAAPSTGYVHSLLARGAGAVTDIVKKIKMAITLAHVVGFDETTLRCGPAGAKRYVLSANTEHLTALFLGNRSLKSFHSFGILDDFSGIAVHDRYSVYDHPDFTGITGHQLCTAHLLRDLQDAAESYPDQSWPTEVSQALRDLIHRSHAARDAGQARIPAPAQRSAVAAFRKAVTDGLAAIPRQNGTRAKQLPARCLLECLNERESDVLRFTTDSRIWPTNNISERALRPEKTQQKISGRLQSESVTQHRLTLRSYLATAAKHRVNMMTALRDAFAGTPWTLPGPAPG